MSELTQGLTISGFGILITFSALGILIGLILLLKRVFPERGEREPITKKQGETSSLAIEVEKRHQKAAAAAVSVLLDQLNRSRSGSLGKLLGEPPTGWWQQGLDRAQGKE